MARVSLSRPSLGDVLEFLRLLWAIDHGLQSLSKRLERTLGVTGPQRLVLRIVGRFPAISAGELAEILHVHPSTLTGVLRRLEQRGFLRRRPDPEDGRRALLALTKAGEGLDRSRFRPIESAVQKTLARMPRTEVAMAEQVLRALAQALDAPRDKSSPRGARRI